MLHTWSLAIEEQYYIAFPLLLLALWPRGRKQAFAAMTGLFLASLFLADHFARTSPDAAFFLLPFRAWELLAGVLCAFLMHSGLARNDRLEQAASLVGIACVLSGFYFIDEASPVPGRIMLLPVLGTVLMILFAREGTWVNRVLGHRWLVGIGLISYSAYLWHQPLLAFHAYYSGNLAATWPRLMIGLVSFPLAYLTWKFVEQPFRKGEFAWVGTRQATFRSAGVSLGLLFVTGLVLLPRAGNVSATAATATEPARACSLDSSLVVSCRPGDEPRIILYGDSYAAHLMPMLESLYPGREVIELTRSACSPAQGFAQVIPGTRYTAEWARDCMQHNRQAMAYLMGLDPSWIILGTPYANTVQNELVFSEEAEHAGNPLLITVNGIRRTVNQLTESGHSVVVVEPPNNNGEDNHRCVKLAQRGMKSIESCAFTSDSYSERTRIALEASHLLDESLKVFRLSRFYCAEGECRPWVDDVAIFKDTGHLSDEGARRFAMLLSPSEFEKFLNTGDGDE